MSSNLYEFHITGEDRLIERVNYEINRLYHGLPILILEKLDEEGFLIETEYMSACKGKFDNHTEAIKHLPNIVKSYGLGNGKGKEYGVHRKKIETVYRTDINPEEYLYIECHYSPGNSGEIKPQRGLSRNLFTGQIILTERCYDHSQFHAFAEQHSDKKVELCILDTFVDKDGDWLDVPKKKKGYPAVTEALMQSNKDLLRKIL